MAGKIVFVFAVLVACCVAQMPQVPEEYALKVVNGAYMGPNGEKAKRSIVGEDLPYHAATYNGNSWGAEVARSQAAAREAHGIVHAAYVQAKNAKDAALQQHSIAVAKELSALQAIKKSEEAARAARERAAEAQAKAIEAQTFYATARARAAAAQKIAAAREATAAKALELALIEQSKELRAKEVENAKKAALRSSENAGAISAAEYSAGHPVLRPHATIIRQRPVVYDPPHFVFHPHQPEWPVL